MFEHFQRDLEGLALSDEDHDELRSILDTYVDAELSNVPEPDPKEWRALAVGLGEVAFYAGQSYRAEVEDQQFITVHLPVAKAGKFIEKLIEED